VFLHEKTHLRLNIHNKGINNILSSGIIVPEGILLNMYYNVASVPFGTQISNSTAIFFLIIKKTFILNLPKNMIVLMLTKTHLRLNIHNKGINNILSSGIIVYSRIDDMYVIVRGWVKLLAGSQLYLLDMYPLELKFLIALPSFF
jgi:hypothetical protein